MQKYGHKKQATNGYIYLYVLGSLKEFGTPIYKLEHRIVWEKAYGPIPDGMHIHHKNGVRDDNRLENLECVTPHQQNIGRKITSEISRIYIKRVYSKNQRKQRSEVDPY